MKKLLLKLLIYTLVILFILEALVRVFHLYPEDSPRFIDELGVEKRVPGFEGFAVTGNRRMNFSEYKINEKGFNSYREFEPSYKTKEIAIVGDSYIQGFHQDYHKSIGAKIEDELSEFEVYEYGYAGYDLADQLHLLHAYKDDFDKIDFIFIYMKYEMDLKRGVYEPNQTRINLLQSPLFKVRDRIKLLSYTSHIGLLDVVKDFLVRTKRGPDQKEPLTEKDRIAYLTNFRELIETYPVDKSKTVLLLDESKTDADFLKYCSNQGISILDFGEPFSKSDKSTTLIYDQHWNDHGRKMIADVILTFVTSRTSSEFN